MVYKGYEIKQDSESPLLEKFEKVMKNSVNFDLKKKFRINLSPDLSGYTLAYFANHPYSAPLIHGILNFIFDIFSELPLTFSP